MRPASPFRARRSAARRSVVTAAIAAAALLLAGCTFFPGGPGSSSTSSTHTDETVAADLKPFYSQTLTWSKASNGIDHPAVTVPLDWSKPASGATVEIAISRHRAGTGSLGS